MFSKMEADEPSTLNDGKVLSLVSPKNTIVSSKTGSRVSQSTTNVGNDYLSSISEKHYSAK